MVLFRKACIIF